MNSFIWLHNYRKSFIWLYDFMNIFIWLYDHIWWWPCVGGCKRPPVREMRPSLLQRFCRSCQSYQSLSRTQAAHSDKDTNIHIYIEHLLLFIFIYYLYLFIYLHYNEYTKYNILMSIISKPITHASNPQLHGYKCII